jgi:hypothetical protein
VRFKGDQSLPPGLRPITRLNVMGAISFRCVAACRLRAPQPIIETESGPTTDRSPSKRQALVLKRLSPDDLLPARAEERPLAFCRLTLPWGPWPPELPRRPFFCFCFELLLLTPSRARLTVPSKEQSRYQRLRAFCRKGSGRYACRVPTTCPSLQGPYSDHNPGTSSKHSVPMSCA